MWLHIPGFLFILFVAGSKGRFPDGDLISMKWLHNVTLQNYRAPIHLNNGLHIRAAPYEGLGWPTGSCAPEVPEL